MNDNLKNIYLDYAAATPARPSVVEAMQQYWYDVFANSQSVHTPGRKAAQAIESSRQQIADTLSVQPDEIVFTSGATEANSLAILGSYRAATDPNKTQKNQVIFSEISHASVRNVQNYQADELEAVPAPVGPDGRLRLSELQNLITDQTIIVSCSYANSEIGTIQPISEIADMIRKYRQANNSLYPLLHVDASQTALYASVRPEALGADLVTLNSQKLYGPKGVGLLWVKKGTPLASLFLSSKKRQVGDYQNLRPGTPPTPLIVGFAEALSWAQTDYQERATAVSDLRDYFITSLEEAFPNSAINGSQRHRVAHNISVTFKDTDHDYLVTQLDAHGIAAATTSACQADRSKGSEVLSRINKHEAVRFSLGISTTKQEINHVMQVLKELLD